MNITKGDARRNKPGQMVNCGWPKTLFLELLPRRSNAATVVLPYDIFDSKSHWNGELETLKANPDVHKVVAFDMKDCNVDIDGEPRELWSRGEPTTEHAG